MNWPLRFGLVTQVDAAVAKARVRFPVDVETEEAGEEGMESHWLAVGHRWSLGAREFVMPTIGEQVACLMDERCRYGVILCGVYSEADTPPEAPAKAWRREWPDGTILQYDPEAHELLAHVEGTVTLEATGDVVVHSDADATVQAGGTATVQAPDIFLDGDVRVSGDITADGEITAGTIPLTTHKHIGVTTGGGTSGTPVP